MSIVLSDYIRFPFNGGRGVRTDQLAGAIVRSITEAGVASVTLADGFETTVTLAVELVRADRDPTAADYDNRRLFYDGIELRKVIRVPVPGHDRVVTFAEDNLDIALLGTGIYADRNAASAANPFTTRPTGLRYYNRSLARWELWQVGQYWDTRRSIAEPQSAQGSLWIGEWPTEAAASSHASRVGQITSFPNEDGEYILHRVATVLSGTEDGFRYELDPLFSLYALEGSDIDNAESDVQGTISGRSLSHGVAEHSPFTDVEQDILDDLSRITFPHPTDDWQVRQTYTARDFFNDRAETFLALGWDSDDRLRAMARSGRVGRLGRHDQGRVYDGSETLRGGLISGDHWLFLRDNGNGSVIERSPVDGGDDEIDFQIVLRYFALFADPDSGELIGILRRIDSDNIEVGILAYDSSDGSITATDTITLTLARINNALSSDFQTLTDVHRESSTGVYSVVSGAILEGDTLYLILTDISKTDGHTASVLVGFTLAGTPNNRTLTILSGDAVDELPIADELISGILPLEADELFITANRSAYRLSAQQPTAALIAIVTDDTITGDGTEDNPAGVASPYPGPVTWPTLGERPNRPTPEELIDGTSVEEATPSVSDVVAIANSHSQRILANEDPEPVAVEATEGTDATVSRRDHVHSVPIDATLEFDPVSGDLGVNVHDVITHLQESIRYYTDSIDHPTDPGGHSAGQMYRTGPFPTTISRVQSQIDVLFGHPSYAARIYHVDSDREVLEFLGESSHFVPLSNNPHSYDFAVDDGIGIPIPANSFIVILFHAVGGVLIPLRTGDEASDSPGKSYQDADRDFNMVHSVVYEHVHPSVGDSTVSHGDNDHIRGNIKIFYDIAYDHGQLLGDSKANTDLQNIDEDLTEAEKQAIRDRIGTTDEIGLVVASSVTQPNSIIQGGLPRFRMNVNTPGNGEPLDGQVLKFRFAGPFSNTAGVNTYSFDVFGVSLFLNNTDIISDAREGTFVYPDGRAVRGDDFPAGVDAYALKIPGSYVWLTSGDILSGIVNTVDEDDVEEDDEIAVIGHGIARDPTRRLAISNLRTIMTNGLSFANRNLDNIILADKAARDGHRVTIGVTPPFKDFPFGSGELLGNVFAGLNNISGATKFRNSLYGVDAAFTPARLVRIDTDDPQNDDAPYGSLGDLDPGIDDPQSLVAVEERLYIVNGNATSAGLWRINPEETDDISGVYGRVGDFPAGLTNPHGSFPANGDIYVVQGNTAPDFDELWRINEFSPASTANPLGIQYSLPANITGAPTSGVWHDGYAYIVTGLGRQLFRIDPDNLSHGQPTTSDNRFGLVGVLPIPDTEIVTAAASLGGVFYVFTGAQIWAKSVGNVEFDRIKANTDLQNISDSLTEDQKQVVRTRIGVASGVGEPIEVLFDNRADTETALSVVQAANGGWHSAADVLFTRALVEADDDKDARIKFRYTQNGVIRSIDELIGAEILRNFTENNSTSGSVFPAGGGHPFLIADGRSTNTGLADSFTRMGLFARGRALTGEDVLRVLFNVVNNVASAISEMRGTVELVPRLGGGAASSQQQQSVAGRALVERTIVSGGTLLAANAFNFDVTSDGAFVAAGLGFAPVPLADIFDFVATIRVGGRAGFPITLSREQFDYIGEVQESVFGTWPFGGSGGGSWGNVSEIPCAMMFLNHRSEGIVKNELAPQRQQIQWTITGTDLVTAILIFFNYDAADENLVSLRLVAFTDQVVEIEGMHVHYWEDA